MKWQHVAGVILKFAQVALLWYREVDGMQREDDRLVRKSVSDVLNPDTPSKSVEDVEM
jgi:hypothetical protein